MPKKNSAAQSLTAMRNKKLSPERRRQIAQQAARTRWKSVQNGAAPTPAGLADRAPIAGTGSAPKERDGADQRNHERTLKRQEKIRRGGK